MTDWQQRVVDEHAELKQKCAKLRVFLQEQRVIEVDDYVLLSLQHSYMKNYLSILAERIEKFNS